MSDTSTPRNPVLVAEQVTKQYPVAGREPLSVLQGVDLSVHAGESVAILGPSGSGKSTLLAILAGLDHPSSGRVWIAGHETTALDESRLAQVRARHLGFVFQSYRLLPMLTAAENVRIALELAGVADPGATARQALHDVGLGERLDHRPQQLSGGEQQRVALARAFAAGPSLVLADEPTGNLDEDTGASMAARLFDLVAHRGTALVLVTHDRDLAFRCDRVVAVDHGQLVAPDPVAR